MRNLLDNTESEKRAWSSLTASVPLSLSMLWYLHDLVTSYHLADCEHAKVALETSFSLEECIIICEDHKIEDSHVQLHAEEIEVLLGLVKPDHKDEMGKSLGREAARSLMRARLALQQGPVRSSSSEYDKSYAEAVIGKEGEDNA